MSYSSPSVGDVVVPTTQSISGSSSSRRWIGEAGVVECPLTPTQGVRVRFQYKDHPDWSPVRFVYHPKNLELQTRFGCGCPVTVDLRGSSENGVFRWYNGDGSACVGIRVGDRPSEWRIKEIKVEPVFLKVRELSPEELRVQHYASNEPSVRDGEKVSAAFATADASALQWYTWRALLLRKLMSGDALNCKTAEQLAFLGECCRSTESIAGRLMRYEQKIALLSSELSPRLRAPGQVWRRRATGALWLVRYPTYLEREAGIVAPITRLAQDAAGTAAIGTNDLLENVTDDDFLDRFEYVGESSSMLQERAKKAAE